MIIDIKRDIFISSLFIFIQHLQPIKGYLWVIVARIIVDSTVNRISHSGGGGGMGAPTSILQFFSKPPPPHYQNWCRHELTPSHLKMKPPSDLKNNPPLKHETPFHEIIPRNSTINNNLQSS